MSHSKNHGIQPMYKWMMAIKDFIIIIIIIPFIAILLSVPCYPFHNHTTLCYMLPLS